MLLICLQLILQPRAFRYKKYQKKRSFIKFNNKNNLIFGDSGLLILKPTQLTAKTLNRYKLLLKRATKRSEKTRRFFWLNAFPYLPLTRKPDGSRMGKGKGKLECWFSQLKGGVIFFEFKNLRHGRSLFFMRQLTHKLGIRTTVVFNNKTKIVFPFKKNKQFFLNLFDNRNLMLWYGFIYYVIFFFVLVISAIIFFKININTFIANFNTQFLLSKFAISFFLFFFLLSIFFIYSTFEIFFYFEITQYTNQIYFFTINSTSSALNPPMRLFNVNLIKVYYFPFIYIFLLITTLSILFCLAYNFSELVFFMLYCFIILISGFTIFFTDSVLIFFIAYEMLLIPSFFILYKFAKTRRCIEAAYLMFFWTQFGAFFLIFSFLYLFFLTNTTYFQILNTFNYSEFEINFFFVCWMLGFGVKLPIWPFYGWLPKAHVEASTNFSIFLSGVLVKFAFFGLLKCLLTVALEPTFWAVIPFLTIGIVDSVFKLFYQIDLKKLVAYSTVVEMHWLTLCVISGQSALMLSSFCMLISHALLSTNSFLLVDAINRRFKTRLITEVSGINVLCPKLFLLSLLNCLIFLGFPGTIFFIAEVLFFSFTFDLFPLLATFLLLLLYLIGPTFFFRTWINILFGNSNQTLKNIPLDLNSKEIILYSTLLILLFWLGISWQAFIF